VAFIRRLALRQKGQMVGPWATGFRPELHERFPGVRFHDAIADFCPAERRRVADHHPLCRDGLRIGSPLPPVPRRVAHRNFDTALQLVSKDAPILPLAWLLDHFSAGRSLRACTAIRSCCLRLMANAKSGIVTKSENRNEETISAEIMIIVSSSSLVWSC